MAEIARARRASSQAASARSSSMTTGLKSFSSTRSVPPPVLTSAFIVSMRPPDRATSAFAESLRSVSTGIFEWPDRSSRSVTGRSSRVMTPARRPSPTSWTRPPKRHSPCGPSMRSSNTRESSLVPRRNRPFTRSKVA